MILSEIEFFNNLGEVSIMDGYVFTARGYKMLQEHICRTKERLSQATKLKSEAGAGQDAWHDEGFKLGLVDEMMWSRRLKELEKILFVAQLIQPEEQRERAEIGVGVVIEYEDGVTDKYIIDGYLMDSEEKRISVYSPLAKAMLGAKEGDERIMVIGDRKITFSIEKIYPPSVAETKVLGKKEDI